MERKLTETMDFPIHIAMDLLSSCKRERRAQGIHGTMNHRLEVAFVAVYIHISFMDVPLLCLHETAVILP